MAARNCAKVLRQVLFQKNVGRIWRSTANILHGKTSRGVLFSSQLISRRLSSAQEERIVTSPHPDVHMPHDVSVTEFVMEHFARYGDAVALVNGITGESFTYNQLRDKITKVAGSLVKMGIKQGYVVTLFSPNCPEFAIMFLAVNRIGATISPLNPLYTPGELTHALSHSKSQLIVTVDELVPVVREALKNCPNVKVTRKTLLGLPQ